MKNRCDTHFGPLEHYLPRTQLNVDGCYGGTLLAAAITFLSRYQSRLRSAQQPLLRRERRYVSRQAI